MGMELYERVRNIMGDTIGLDKQYMITISSKFREYLRDSEWVTLHYDKDSGEIGIKPVSGDTPNRLKLISPWRGVSAKGFCKYFNIVVSQKYCLPARWNAGRGMLIVQAKDVI